MTTAVVLMSCTQRDVSVADYGVIPLPRTVNLDNNADGFRLENGTAVVYPSGDSVMGRNAELFAGYVKEMTGLTLTLSEDRKKDNAIILHDNLVDSCSEAYRIIISADSIVVDGASAAGVFYGLQTLRKAITPEPNRGENDILFPAGEIYDYPQFAYRGAHFDTSRHFFTPDSVKMFIDMIALHNINKFHWHITDDQGWRIEIKSRPELAEKGQWRSGTVIVTTDEEGRAHFNDYDSIPYGGYYTQEQVRDIVRYAADRHITVIPEIDMPGHMQAALATYPELGCTGGPYEVWRRWGVSDDVLCAGNDSVYKFIEDVLGEIVELFPSELVHIGGDECPKVRWKECPKCQAMIKRLGLKSDAHGTAEQKLQSYLMGYAADFLQKHGRKIVGWNEMLEGGLPDGAVVMSWTGINGAVEAARQGHDAILTPCKNFYFDFVQADKKIEPQGATWGGPTTVEDVYNFNPAPEGLSESELNHIVGVQANLWCEYVTTMRHAQYMELPRMAALAEVQWRPYSEKNYEEFLTRLPRLATHYDAMGYNYAKHVFNKDK